MRAVKIILGIIIVVSIIFFSTGLVVKENKYDVSIEVNRPLSEVFLKFNDLSQIKKWIPEIKSIDTLNFNPGITGSKFKMAVNNQGEEIVMEEKVLAYIQNEKVTLFFDAEGMLKTDQYIFTDQEGKTLIQLNSTFKSENSYILSCVFPYFKGIVKSQDEQYLANFKAFAEN